MRLAWAPYVFVASVVLVVACGDDDDGAGGTTTSSSGGTGPTGSTGGFGTSSGSTSTSSSGGDDIASLRAYAIAYCKKLMECTPVSFNESWANKDECIDDVDKSNRDSQKLLPGLTITQEQVNGCAAEISSTSCAFGRTDLRKCARKGSLKDGTACYDAAQCASGRCKYENPNNDCGSCGTFEATGGDCFIDSDCDFGAMCFDGKCAKHLAKDAECTAEGVRCVAGLVCAKGTCREPVDVNGACERSRECRRGLSCLDTVCKEKPSKAASLGETCDAQTVCRKSSCRGAPGATRCIAYATTEQACGDAVDGPADCDSNNNCFEGHCSENTFPSCK